MGISTGILACWLRRASASGHNEYYCCQNRLTPEVIVATSGGASTYYVQVNGQILAQYGSGAWAYALPDHLGSVSQLSNAGGQVILYAAKALRNGG